MPSDDAKQSPFISKELRPTLMSNDADAPLDPEISMEELQMRARAVLADDGLSSIDAQSSNVGFWNAVFAHSRDVNSTVLDGEAVVLNLDNGHYYTLNRVGTAIWEQLDGRRRLAAILSAICNRFDVTEDLARRDVSTLVDHLRAEGLIEETAGKRGVLRGGRGH